MTAAIFKCAFRQNAGSRMPGLTKGDIYRALGAGAAFSVMLTGGFAAMSAWQCGGVCLPETIGNAALSFAAGAFGLGPVVIFGRRRDA